MKAICAALAFLLGWYAIAPIHVHIRMANAAHDAHHAVPVTARHGGPVRPTRPPPLAAQPSSLNCSANTTAASAQGSGREPRTVAVRGRTGAGPKSSTNGVPSAFSGNPPRFTTPTP